MIVVQQQMRPRDLLRRNGGRRDRIATCVPRKHRPLGVPLTAEPQRMQCDAGPTIQPTDRVGLVLEPSQLAAAVALDLPITERLLQLGEHFAATLVATRKSPGERESQ